MKADPDSLLRVFQRCACASLLTVHVVLGANGSSKVAPGPDTRRFESGAISVEVTPLAGESVAAFLMGRGIPSTAARRYASSCVVRIVVSHPPGGEPVTYDVRDWRILPENVRLKTKESWLSEWQGLRMERGSLIGFEYSQLPTAVELAPGDSALGMSSIPLRPGRRFDLSIAWSEGRGRLRAVLEGVRCHAP